MSDSLTQLQDAVDQFARQMVATLNFVHRRHSLETLGPGDKIRDVKQEQDRKEVDPLPPDEFKQGLIELSRDLVIKEQQIEVLISSLPGLDSSENEQYAAIGELAEELNVATQQYEEAVKQKTEMLRTLQGVFKGVRRPK